MACIDIRAYGLKILVATVIKYNLKCLQWTYACMLLQLQEYLDLCFLQLDSTLCLHFVRENISVCMCYLSACIYVYKMITPGSKDVRLAWETLQWKVNVDF